MMATAAATCTARVAGRTRVHGTRKLVTWLGLVLVLLGVGSAFARHVPERLLHSVAFDYEINMVGAERLLEGKPLYDVEGSRQTAASRGRLEPGQSFISRSDAGYIGPPALALLHAPFDAVGEPAATMTFRGLMLVLVLGSVALVARVLPLGNRMGPSLVVVGALLLTAPLFSGLILGQANGVVMLTFALAIWGTARGQWNIVGMALGVAILLKVSPALILVYLVVRGRKQVLAPAISVAAALSVCAAALGQPLALWTWLAEIVPSISRGTRFINNQSAPALLDRVLMGGNDVVANVPLGPARLVGAALTLVLTFLLWRARRGRRVVPLEVGTLILVLLFVGPLSWDHYFVWAFLPVLLLLDADVWFWMRTTQRFAVTSLLILAFALLSGTIRWASVSELRDQWLLRVTGSPYPIAAVALLLACSIALGSIRQREMSDDADPRLEPLDTALVVYEHPFVALREPIA